MHRLLLPMILALLLSPSCGLSSKVGATLDDYRAVATKVNKVGEKLEQGLEALQAKLAAAEAKNAEIVASLESIAGPMDTDGDGDVTIAEGRAFYSKLKESAEGKKALENPDTYIAIIATIAGLWGAKKGGGIAVKALHKTGRKMVGPSQPS